MPSASQRWLLRSRGFALVPPLDPVDLGVPASVPRSVGQDCRYWHLCHFGSAKWQSYMSADRCPQAHLMDPHATFASCVLCSQPSFALVDEIAAAPERLW